MPIISASLPCIGGIIEPPKIIIIKNAEPCVVYFPSPAIDKAKIAGHIIEQNNPPLKNAYIETIPVVNKPISIAIIPSVAKSKSVFAGFCSEIKNAIILLAKTEGIFTEPAGGVSVGVLKKLIEENKIDKDEKVVCYVTGNGLKTTESIIDLLPALNPVKPDVRLVSAMIH